jgi:hypothetical protein
LLQDPSPKSVFFKIVSSKLLYISQEEWRRGLSLSLSDDESSSSWEENSLSLSLSHRHTFNLV